MAKLSKEFIEQVYLEKLKNKLTNKQIQQKYGFDPNYWFKKYDFIKTKENFKRSENKIPIKYKFESINSETEAYILGLLLSDGSISSNSQLQIKLKADDSELKLLQSVVNYISPDTKIIVKQNTAFFRIASVEIRNNLEKYGMTPEKTYTLNKIPNLPKHLYRHFIRGYFDGDGTVFMDRKWLRSNICSISENFLIEIQALLNDANIENRINVEIRKNKKYKVPQGVSENCMNMYRLYISKQEALKKFYHYLYDDATIYLERKKIKFEDNIELT